MNSSCKSWHSSLSLSHCTSQITFTIRSCFCLGFLHPSSFHVVQPINKVALVMIVEGMLNDVTPEENAVKLV